MRVQPARQSPDVWYSSLVESVDRSAACFELAYRAVQEMREVHGRGLTVDHHEIGRRLEDLSAATDRVISESARVRRRVASRHEEIERRLQRLDWLRVRNQPPRTRSA